MGGVSLEKGDDPATEEQQDGEAVHEEAVAGAGLGCCARNALAPAVNDVLRVTSVEIFVLEDENRKREKKVAMGNRKRVGGGRNRVSNFDGFRLRAQVVSILLAGR